MNVNPSAAEKFTLRGYARQEAREVVQGYKDAFVGTGQGLAEGYSGLKNADGLGASLKAGVAAGFKVGSGLGHLAAVPAAVACTVTHGLWAIPLFGALGGFHIGSKTGEVMGRLATADEPDSKKHALAALTGSLGGGVAGAVLGMGSPVAAAVGAVTAVTSAVKLVAGLGGAAVGGVVGFATWGVKKALAAMQKETPPAPPQQPPAEGGAPAPPAQGEAPAPPAQAPPAEGGAPAPPAAPIQSEGGAPAPPADPVPSEGGVRQPGS